MSLPKREGFYLFTTRHVHKTFYVKVTVEEDVELLEHLRVGHFFLGERLDVSLLST